MAGRRIGAPAHGGAAATVLVLAVTMTTLLVSILPAASAARPPMTGGIAPCGEERRAEVQEIAQWAVIEHNNWLAQRGKRPVTMLHVISANCQVVAGEMFYIKVRLRKANGKTTKKTFKVLDQPWIPHRELVH